MITFTNIGYEGRLGNQMFQCAATIGAARWAGVEPKFPEKNIQQTRKQCLANGETVDTFFEVPKVFPKIHEMLFQETSEELIHRYIQPGFNYDPGISNVEDCTELHGYFQSERFFKHVEKEIRILYDFGREIKEKARDVFPKNNLPKLAIHIRRGDYVSNTDNHTMLPVSYYQKGINTITSEVGNVHYMIFSDDINFCKGLFGEHEHITYIDQDAHTSLCLMSWCDHFVIANSSYSWWGAWLSSNPRKTVVAPKDWFGPNLKHHNTKDLYCKEWIIV